MSEPTPREDEEREGPMRAAVVSPPRRRWLRRVVLGGLLSGLAVAAIVLYLRKPGRLDCESATRGEPYGIVVVVCQEEYARTHAPATGARLADALRRSGDRPAATTLANQLLATEARADALWILGEIARWEERMDAAAGLLQEARALHRAAQRRAALAKDDLSLAGVHALRRHLAEALYSLDECIAEARAAGDRSVEGLCHVAAARVLNYAGYFDGTLQELELAAPLLSTDLELAKLWFERGNSLQEQARGQDRNARGREAVTNFQQALRFATRARATDMALAIELNLTVSLAELHRIAEAEAHLATATALDRDQDYQSNIAQLTAQIAYHRGDLRSASAQLAKLYEAMPPGDERFEVCVMQARIALSLDDLADAERWARRGIEEVEQIHASQTALELRPWVLASRRAPYELRFVALARAGRFEEAIAVFDRWQGHTLLDAMARRGPRGSSSLAATASHIQSLGQLLPAAGSVALMSTGDRGAAQALRSIDLLALAVAEGEVWRITARRGQLRIDKLGPLAPLLDLLDGFQAAPTDPARATAAGARLLPAELLRDPTTLHVVLDAPFASLPVAALRGGGKPLIAVRPVLRLPRLPAGPTGAACTPPAVSGGATVLADADGTLPRARRESEAIAPLLQAVPRVGDAATSAALFAARSASVLHVAVHADFGTGGGILRLHDRSVSALEISVERLGPSLVVLSGCSTARSDDPELAGSLATAFLASGSSEVLATLRPISDLGAVDVMSHFYERGGTADPVRTLAAIQAELAGTGNQDWPSFAVFGKQVCAP